MSNPGLLLIACALIAPIAAHAASPPVVKPWKADSVIITFWCPPPATDEALANVVAEGYNLTWTPEAGLDVAGKHGLKAMLQDPLLVPETLDNPDARAKLDALIVRVKGNPALDAYFLRDEPSASDFAGLGKLVAYLRQRDPAHLAYINLFPTYADNKQLGTTGDTVTAYREYLRRFVEIVKPGLISWDHYHFFKANDGKEYFLNLAMVREQALAAHLPFLNIIQACTIEKTWRLPNPDEMRWLVYTTLAYGARGISYFTYWGPREYGGLYQDGMRMPLADAVTALNKEIAALSPELMKLDSLGVYHAGSLPLGCEAVADSSPVRFDGAGDFVLGLFGKHGNVSAFMVVNRDYGHAADAKLHLAGGSHGLEEFDCASRRWNPCARPDRDGDVAVHLAPGDGKLLRLKR